MPNADRTYRLLIVDDDETDRRLYCWLLERQAPGTFEIEQVADGASGIAALRARRFDCLLLDFSLPDVTGLEFLAEATIDGELPCAVVLITGHGNEAIAVEAMKLGVQDYLVKDHVNEGRLYRAIGRAVSQRELRQNLARSMRALTASNTTLEQEVAAHKVTEAALRVAKEAAEQADQTKTRFVAMITHELRTPLNGILGYAQLLRIEGGLSARQDARVTAMMQAGRHLFGMIERVLDFSSMEAGKVELHPVPIKISDLTEGCISFIGLDAADRGLDLRIVSAHDAPRKLFADPDRLRHVLLNLLGNAVKFTSAGGVELRVLAGASGALRIEVADTGPGIKEASRGRLFQDFERLDAPNAIEGAGLGLAISARFIHLMGGIIGHTPNAGGGSIFWLELPTGEVDAATSPNAALTEVSEIGGTKPDRMLASAEASIPQTDIPQPETSRAGSHMLLVDDIMMNRDVIGAFLRAAGHEVTLAENGGDGVRLAAGQDFDLILMDVRMPEMDGLEATRRIRALQGPRGQVPVLALTAYSFPEQILQCREAGMNGHVAKPVDYDTMMHSVARVIARGSPGWFVEDTAPCRSEPEPWSPPRLDRGVLDQLLTFLPADEIAANLRSLRVRKEQLLRLMEQSAEPATAHEVTRAALTDTAHALVSTAGLFGFSALSATARRFEQAIAADSENAALARQLCEETRAGLALLNSLLPENRMQTEHRLQAEQRLHAEPAARTEPRHAPADLDEGSAWWR